MNQQGDQVRQRIPPASLGYLEGVRRCHVKYGIDALQRILDITVDEIRDDKQLDVLSFVSFDQLLTFREIPHSCMNLVAVLD